MGRNGQHYMTERERYQLEAYLKAKKPKAWIAREMGFCRQTIYNETRRGEVWLVDTKRAPIDIKRYSADKAQQIHDYNQTAKGRPIKLGNHHDYARRLEGLMLGVGKTRPPFVYNITGMWCIRIVGTFICTRFLGMGLISAWACMIAHNMLLFILYLITYIRGSWNPLR